MNAQVTRARVRQMLKEVALLLEGTRRQMAEIDSPFSADELHAIAICQHDLGKAREQLDEEHRPNGGKKRR